MKNKWAIAGFTQKRPEKAGVYYFKTDGHLPLHPPPRLIKGWDLADVYFDSGGWGNVYMNSEKSAHWRITTLNGVSFAWRRGMWLKGPISPFDVAP